MFSRSTTWPLCNSDCWLFDRAYLVVSLLSYDMADNICTRRAALRTAVCNWPVLQVVQQGRLFSINRYVWLDKYSTFFHVANIALFSHPTISCLSSLERSLQAQQLQCMGHVIFTTVHLDWLQRCMHYFHRSQTCFQKLTKATPTNGDLFNWDLRCLLWDLLFVGCMLFWKLRFLNFQSEFWHARMSRANKAHAPLEKVIWCGAWNRLG